MCAAGGDAALEASSGSQDQDQVDWDAPLSTNAPGSNLPGTSSASSGASAAAVVAPSRRMAQDALSLAEDAASVRHGKGELAQLACIAS